MSPCVKTGGPASSPDLPVDPIVIQILPISKQLASVVIGTRGDNVTKIRRKSGCKVHVRPRPRSNEGLQEVELQGRSEQVSADASTTRAASSQRQDEHDCLSSFSGTCVMPGVEVTGARWMGAVQDRTDTASAASFPIVVAVEAIRELCREVDPACVIEVPEPCQAHIEVLPEMVGAVLGSRGAMVKSIREKTGADIHVEELQPGAVVQYVHIKGTVPQVKAGYDWVRGILERFDPHKVRGNAPPRHPNGGGPLGMHQNGGGPPPHFNQGPPPRFNGPPDAYNQPPPPYQNRNAQGPGPYGGPPPMAAANYYPSGGPPHRPMLPAGRPQLPPPGGREPFYPPASGGGPDGGGGGYPPRARPYEGGGRGGGGGGYQGPRDTGAMQQGGPGGYGQQQQQQPPQGAGAPGAGGASGQTPTILILQADGTYKPAQLTSALCPPHPQVMMYNQNGQPQNSGALAGSMGPGGQSLMGGQAAQGQAQQVKIESNPYSYPQANQGNVQAAPQQQQYVQPQQQQQQQYQQYLPAAATPPAAAAVQVQQQQQPQYAAQAQQYSQQPAAQAQQYANPSGGQQQQQPQYAQQYTTQATVQPAQQQQQQQQYAAAAAPAAAAVAASGASGAAATNTGSYDEAAANALYQQQLAAYQQQLMAQQLAEQQAAAAAAQQGQQQGQQQLSQQQLQQMLLNQQQGQQQYGSQQYGVAATQGGGNAAGAAAATTETGYPQNGQMAFSSISNY
ncbi:MAG: hypothetical protein WDW36_007731 [Sanguina aurantia]